MLEAQLLLHEDVGGKDQMSLALVERQSDRRVELLQNLLVALEAEGAKEDRPGELPFPVDADAEEALGVDLELHPGAAVRNDLPNEGMSPLLREEDARRPVELGDNDALRAVDDEGAVVRHQGDVSEVDLLLLDVPNRPLLRGALPRRGVLLVEDLQPERHLERDGVSEPALLALGHGEGKAELDRSSADLVDRDLVRVRVPAHLALDAAGPRILDPHRRPAVFAGEAQVLDTLETAAARGQVADPE